MVKQLNKRIRLSFLAIIAILYLAEANAQTSIYSIQLDSIAGTNKILLSAFAGKKILIVNTASQDTSASQYAELLLLKQRFGDTLAIIAIPTNSFGTETNNNSTIASFYAQSGSIQFPVAAKASVTGADIHPLYAWLTQQSQNGVTNATVGYAFKKYLINESGQLVGIFSKRIRPASEDMISAIHRSK